MRLSAELQNVDACGCFRAGSLSVLEQVGGVPQRIAAQVGRRLGRAVGYKVDVSNTQGELDW